MSSFKIINADETDKIWNTAGVGSGQGKYPWRELQVGESFFIPRNQITREDYRPTPSPTIVAEGLRFSTRKVTKNSKVGVLVKRVA